MCGQDPQLEQFDWHVLPDPDVQSKVKQVLNNHVNIYWDFEQKMYYFWSKLTKA